MRTILRNLILTAFFSMACVFAQEEIISQIADGAGWRSVLVVTNTTAVATAASISFFKDTTGGGTTAWTPTFSDPGIDPAALNLSAGSSVFLHTPGTAAALTQGWAQIEGGSGVDAYVIYTYSAAGQPKQDATAPALSPATRFLLPFDNTAGLVTTMAFVNPNPIALSISANFSTSSGGVAGTPLNIPANGHLAFVMPTQFAATAGKDGLAEFYSSTLSFSMIALRAHSPGPLSFTSVPVFGETGPPIITTSGGGGGGGGGGVPANDITFAGFSIGKNTGSAGNLESVGGLIAAYTPTAWNLPFNGTKVDKCIVYDITYDPTSTYPSAPELSLDAGKLTLTGPGLAGGSVVVTELNTTGSIGPVYSLQLPSGSLHGGGTYNLAAAGGTQVEAFNAAATLPDNFTSNVNTITSINRSNPLAINWTGTGFENVIISATGTVINLPANIHSVVITCVVPASQHSYSIPTAALSKLPAVVSGGLSSGSLAISTAPAISGTVSGQGVTSTSLTPNLVGGGKVKYGAFAPYYTISSTLTSIQ